jgi:hypothetical protein
MLGEKVLRADAILCLQQPPAAGLFHVVQALLRRPYSPVRAGQAQFR